jgi:hypothetical protein
MRLHMLMCAWKAGPQLLRVSSQGRPPGHLLLFLTHGQGAWVAQSTGDVHVDACIKRSLLILDRFTPEVVSVATFAWTWLMAEAPELHAPVTAHVVGAWDWSLQQGLGLAHTMPPRGARPAFLAALVTGHHTSNTGALA